MSAQTPKFGKAPTISLKDRALKKLKEDKPREKRRQMDEKIEETKQKVASIKQQRQPKPQVFVTPYQAKNEILIM